MTVMKTVVRRLHVIRVFGNTLPHKRALKALGLTWDPTGDKGDAPHWFSIRLTKSERDTVRDYCKRAGLKVVEEKMVLDSHYMLYPGLY